jgi:hypothetical protein
MRSLVIAAAAAAVGVGLVLVSLARADAPAPSKTLEEITIEGEVRLPEVLFITSRDVERPLDSLAGYLVAQDSLAARLDAAPLLLHVTPAAEAAPPEGPTQEEPR